VSILPSWRWLLGWAAAGSAGVAGHGHDWPGAALGCAVVAAMVAWGVRDRLVATKAMMMMLQRVGDASREPTPNGVPHARRAPDDTQSGRLR
jgi:hypothetical protein